MRIFKNLSGKRVSESRYFKKSQRIAGELLKDPAKLRNLVEKVKRRTARLKGTDIWDTVMACMRLILAYAKREYTVIPWQSMLLITAAVVYLWMPFDLIPDYILGVGLVDDITLLRWALKRVKSDIDSFCEWEKRQKGLKNQSSTDIEKEIKQTDLAPE